jgi:hypothetical protein
MRAVAIIKSGREKTTGFQEMGTLRCDGCGEEFFIGRNPQSVDKWVAEKQAKWLEKSWRKNTSAIRSTQTESNYQSTCFGIEASVPYNRLRCKPEQGSFR